MSKRSGESRTSKARRTSHSRTKHACHKQLPHLWELCVVVNDVRIFECKRCLGHRYQSNNSQKPLENKIIRPLTIGLQKQKPRPKDQNQDQGFVVESVVDDARVVGSAALGKGSPKRRRTKRGEKEQRDARNARRRAQYARKKRDERAAQYVARIRFGSY